MRLSKKILLTLAVVALIGAALGRYFLYMPVVAPPALTGNLKEYSILVGGLERRFNVYRPARALDQAAAVFVLHGSRGSGARIRSGSGFGFDEQADQHGFVVVYPEGFDQHWNDCRTAGRYQARQQNVDDIGFFRAIIALLTEEYGVDRQRIFMTGLSNGGHMAFRIALEAPELARGYAAIAANLPAADNQSCEPSGTAVAMLIINGADDPINPYEGGEVTLLGPFGARGRVESAQQTVEYWANLAGYSEAPFFHHYPDSAADDRSIAERQVWSAQGRPEVALITIDGGGHTIPGPNLYFPVFLGGVNRDFSAPEEICRFFLRQLPTAD